LNGDIVFPAGFLDGLLGSSTPAATSSTTPGTTGTNSSTTDGIVNAVDANAQSGSADTLGNTEAGSATSGSAATGQSIFNLINTDLFANNAVLVIVNVLGQWVGKILTLPGGTSTSALLTSGATVSGTGGSSNDQSNSNTQNGIVNNVQADATSGNADVDGNTEAGNATSGNADVANNAANIVGSNINASNWFGVLFINVFGTWNGSIDNGTPTSSDTSSTTPSAMPTGIVALVASVPQVSQPSTSDTFAGSGSGSQDVSNQSAPTTSVGSINTNNGVKMSASNIPAATAASTKSTGFLFMLSAIVLMIAAGLAGLERKLRRI
jgi:hypothetical protein